MEKQSIFIVVISAIVTGQVYDLGGLFMVRFCQMFHKIKMLFAKRFVHFDFEKFGRSHF